MAYFPPIYGSMYQEGLSTVISIATMNVDYDITGMGTGILKGMTFQNAKELLISSAGTYSAIFHVSFSDSGSVHYEMAIMVNSTRDDKSVSHKTTVNSSDLATNAGASILTLAVGDIVKLVVRNSTNSNDPTISHAHLMLMKIDN